MIQIDIYYYYINIKFLNCWILKNLCLFKGKPFSLRFYPFSISQTREHHYERDSPYAIHGRPESSKIPISCSPDIRANKGFNNRIVLSALHSRVLGCVHIFQKRSHVHVRPRKFESIARISCHVDKYLYDVPFT